MKIMRKMKARLKDPRKMRKASIWRLRLIACAMKKFQTETLHTTALERMKTAYIKYLHDEIKDSIFR